MPTHGERNSNGYVFYAPTYRWISQELFEQRSVSSPPDTQDLTEHEETTYCEYCEIELDDQGEQYTVGDTILCESCYDENTQECDWCQEYYLEGDLATATSNMSRGINNLICQHCLNDSRSRDHQYDPICDTYIINPVGAQKRNKTILVYSENTILTWINVEPQQTGEDVKRYLMQNYRYNDQITIVLSAIGLPDRIKNQSYPAQLTDSQRNYIEETLQKIKKAKKDLPAIKMPESRCLNIHEATDEEMNQGNGVYCVNCIKTPLMRTLEEKGEYESALYLTERAKFMNHLETTLIPQKIRPDNYHHPLHDNFKARKYRLPDEHPYLYYGAEIEIDLPSGRNRITFAETICMVSEGLFVAERDASIPNGVEFITRPMSYKAWTSDKVTQLLDKVFDVMDKWGANTINQEHSGLHIHMSKKFFNKSKTKTTDQQLQDLAWIFEFYNKEIAQFSRRELNEFCQTREYKVKNQFARKNDINNIKMKIQLEKDGLIKSTGSGDSHHHIIAETNQTVEIRSFKTVTNTGSLLAAIEFSRNIAHYVRNYTTEGKNLQQILSAKRSPYLDEYMKQRKLDFSNSTIIKDYIDIELNNNKEMEDF